MLNENQYDYLCIQSAKKIIKQDTCVLFDVGTNIGNYISLFKENFNNIKVYGFEPNPDIFYIAKQKFENDPNVEINNFGLNDEDCEATLHFPENLTVLASMFQRKHFSNFTNIKKISAKFTTLDNFCLKNNVDRIDYLKVDTEGNELSVLNGAKEYFKNKKVICGQIEYGGTYPDANISIKDIIRFFNKYDYELYDVETNTCLSELHFSSEDFQLRNYFFKIKQ